jgi:hypothetical protein
MQQFLTALAQNGAPSVLAVPDAVSRAYLANAVTALLSITDGLLRGDSAKVNAGRFSYAEAIASADADVSAMGNG